MSASHPLHRYTMLIPKYVSRFQCIGPQCEDNCCTGWAVSLDKKTYKLYRNSRHKVLVERFSYVLERSKKDDVNDYARIKLSQPSRECPFLEEKLCAIHRELGAEGLSNTCFDYPRRTWRISGNLQQALLLSCPEAARLALLDADAFDFIQVPLSVRDQSVCSVAWSDSFIEARLFCLQLLRTGALDIWQRLAILGVFCEKLNAVEPSRLAEDLPAILADFMHWIEQNDIVADLGEGMPNYLAQLQLFSCLLHLNEPRSGNEKELHDLVVQGLGDPDTSTEQQRITNYQSGLERMALALGEVPHFFENYLLNETFRDGFPFGHVSPMEHYLRIIFRFGVLRLMLAGLCNADRGTLPKPLIMARMAQTAARRFQHHAHLEDVFCTAIKKNSWDNLVKLFGLLRV